MEFHYRLSDIILAKVLSVCGNIIFSLITYALSPSQSEQFISIIYCNFHPFSIIYAIAIQETCSRNFGDAKAVCFTDICFNLFSSNCLYRFNSPFPQLKYR